MTIRSMTSVFALLFVSGFAIACGGEDGVRSEAASDRTSRSAAVAASSDDPADAPLCDRIDDDTSLTPSGAEPLPHPGVEAANSERRCMALFGVDMGIDELRGFYRSTLTDLGYEVTNYQEGDGIARGNLSRTFLRASKPGRRVSVQIDEFDPSETNLARHTANVKLQIDATRD